MSEKQNKEIKEMIPAGAKYCLEIEDKKCYLKGMSRPILETALGLIMPTNGTPKLITAGEMILNACWLGGDEEIRKDDELLSEASLKCVELIERKNAVLKKL